MIGDDINMNQKYDKPITYDELYEKIKKIIKKQDELDIINNAYGFALNKHEGRKRRNGDDYVSHPLEVANILTDLNVDYITLASAILHETINHGETTVEEIKEEFGEEIATIVHSLSKINRLELSDDKDSSAAYLRKVLVGLSEDVRVLFIKLADRLAFYTEQYEAGVIDDGIYNDRTIADRKKVSELRTRRNKLLTDDEDEQCIDELRQLILYLESQPKAILSFNENIFNGVVERVTVEENKLCFEIKSGILLKEVIAWN